MSIGKTLGNHGSNDYVCLLGVLLCAYMYIAIIIISLAHIIYAIVLLCESAQQFRALMMILQ